MAGNFRPPFIFILIFIQKDPSPPPSFSIGFLAMVEIRLKRGESVDKALRRLKKKLDREGILRDVRARRSYEKPSVKRRRKMKEPKINFYGNFSL